MNQRRGFLSTVVKAGTLCAVSTTSCIKQGMQLTSADGSVQLMVEPLDSDILVVVLYDGASVINSLFSQLCKISSTKPWALQPQQFSSVMVADNNESYTLIGEGNHFTTTATLSFDGNRLKMQTQWKCTAASPVVNGAVGLALPLTVDAATERITMPHILYNDNPSADPTRTVPHFGKEPGALLVCEEDRFPIPAVNVEWQQAAQPTAMTLFSIPNEQDRDWSLGCERTGAGLQLVSVSGVLGFNGKRDIVYGRKATIVPMEYGYRQIRPGDTIEKTCMLTIGEAEQTGWGFRQILHEGYDIFRPQAKPILSIDRVIALKTNAMNARWVDTKDATGYYCLPPGNRFGVAPYLLAGWVGQTFRLAWCSAKIGIEQEQPEMIERARRAIEFFIDNDKTGTPGLSWNRYFTEDKSWQGERDGTLSSRSLGERTYNLGKVIRLFQSSGLDVPQSWITYLTAAADFYLRPTSQLPEGIFPIKWNPDGTPTADFTSAAGIPCASGLLEAYRASGEAKYLTASKEKLELYWKMHGDTFDRPFARSTLDAGCEDKEAGLYFFLAAYEMYKETGEDMYRRWAEVSGDWILTFVYHWHTGFKSGSICDVAGFVTTGWPGVSVQNHHLDVFFPAFELADLGRRTGNDRFVHLGRTVFDAWSHGICREPGDWDFQIPGEQGEQFYQTNYGQGRDIDMDSWRGGTNPWNPAWIIALVLEVGLQFQYDV